MANELEIEIGGIYEINGDTFELNDIQANYFMLLPLKVNGNYHTSEDGFTTMKAIQFSKAKKLS